MARKKVSQNEDQVSASGKTLAERLSGLDKICSEATKNGMALAGRIDTTPEIAERLTLKYIPTPSEDINMLVGGGIPRGKLTVVSGMPDSGKTSILLETISKNMKKDLNMVCVWIESENSIDKDTILKLHKIDSSRFYFIAQDKKYSAEGIGDLLTNLLSSDLKPDMVVINSLKMLTTKNETDRSLSKQSMAEQARFNSRLMNKLVPLLAESNCALAIVQPLSTSLTVLMGDPYMLAGGLAIRYAASMIWEFRKQSVLDSDPIGKEEGMKIKMFCRKNHCLTDRFPYGSVIYYVEYGRGIEQTLSLLKLLIDNNVLVQRGAWIYLLDEKGEKQDEWSWNSKAMFKQDMDANPEKLETLRGLLNGANMIINATDEEIAEIEAEEQLIEDTMKELGE